MTEQSPGPAGVSIYQSWLSTGMVPGVIGEGAARSFLRWQSGFMGNVQLFVVFIQLLQRDECHLGMNSTKLHFMKHSPSLPQIKKSPAFLAMKRGLVFQARTGAIIAGVIAGMSMADAADIYWNGVGTGWDSTADWSTVPGATTPNPGAVPGASDTAIFNITTVTSNQTVNLNAAQSAQGLTFNNTGTTSLQSGGGNQALTLGSGGITVASGAGAVTVGAPSPDGVGITLSTSQTWTNNSDADFLKTGNQAVGLGANTLTLTANGAGLLRVNSSITGTGSVVITNGTIQRGAGGTFTGGLTLNGGTLEVFGNNSAMGAGTVTINGGTIQTGNTTARDYANAIVVGADFTLQGGGTLGGGIVQLSGSIDLGGATRTIAATGNVNAAWTLSGQISNGGLTKDGAGKTLILSGTNVYTGGTTISAGTLLLSGTGSINASNTSVAAGAILTNDSSTSFASGLTLAEAAVVNGSGSFAPTALTLVADLSDGFTTFDLGTTSFLKGNNLELTLSGVTSGTYNVFSGSALSGIFASMTVGGNALTSLGGGDFGGTFGGFTYTFTDASNTLDVVAIPEPATWALLAAGLTVAMVMRRRVN